MSYTELILRCCHFVLWCQKNPWRYDGLFNCDEKKEGYYGLDTMAGLDVENVGVVRSYDDSLRVLPDDWTRSVAGQGGRRRSWSKLPERGGA